MVGEKGLPATYRVQKSCVVCIWVYIWCQQDELPKCHCTKYATPRPPDGSYGTDEDFARVMAERHPSPHSTDEYAKLFVEIMDAWRDWSEEYRVETCGKCREFTNQGGG